MNIIHIIQSMDPASGGPPMVVSRLASGQSRLGHSTIIISGDAEGSLGDDDDSQEKGFMPGRVQVIKANASPGILGLFDRRLRRLLAAEVSPGTVFHLHGIWEPLLWVAAAVARGHRIPYVVTPHGMLDRWSLGNRKWKKRLALALGYRSMLEKAAFLHALNENEKDQIAHLGITAPMEIIPNGIDIAEYPEIGSTDKKAEPDLPTKRPYILFLGRLHYKKGLDYLADAFARVANRCPDIDLVVAGPDYGERANFEGRIAGFGLNGRVHVVGPVHGLRKLELIRGAACFCLPSRSEGFSIAVLEAMAAGIPVVLSTGCHFPAVAETGAGYVAELESGQFADAMLALVEDRERSASMGRAARRLVETSYTWSKIADKSISKYEDVIANRENDYSRLLPL
jgi:glycosyltransferase involved in cell wall biosynthesis